MMIVRALFLLSLVAVFSLAFSKKDFVVRQMNWLSVSGEAPVIFWEGITPDSSSSVIYNKPTFMQVETINQAELPAQARIGYLLSRGF